MERRDLAELEQLLLRADSVVAMEDVFDGRNDEGVIGLRHDIDDNAGSFTTAIKMAHWEAARGFRSTYFVLHGSHYWRNESALQAGLFSIASCGHEIALHCNAIADSLRHGSDPHALVEASLDLLRGFGHRIRGVVAHGDPLCRNDDRSIRFVNDEIFTECARPEVGPPRRTLTLDGVRIKLKPRPLADFGLEYDSNRLSRRTYISDSGDRWNIQPRTLRLPEHGPIHVLQHPDWYPNAL